MANDVIMPVFSSFYVRKRVLLMRAVKGREKGLGLGRI